MIYATTDEIAEERNGCGGLGRQWRVPVTAGVGWPRLAADAARFEAEGRKGFVRLKILLRVGSSSRRPGPVPGRVRVAA